MANTFQYASVSCRLIYSLSHLLHDTEVRPSSEIKSDKKIKSDKRKWLPRCVLKELAEQEKSRPLKMKQKDQSYLCACRMLEV